MVRIQPSTLKLANQVSINRKRKRKESEYTNGSADASVSDAGSTTSSTTTIPTKSEDGSSASNPSLKKQASFSFVETTIEWPSHFTSLSQTHRALNLVYTFCGTRKHFATTFDNIKSTVESHISRELKIEDIAQMKVLMSQAMFFGYVKGSTLQVSLLGDENGFRRRTARDLPPLETMENGEQDDTEVLLLEYLDGDLKRQVQHAKTGEATKPTTKLRSEKLKMPVFSQKQMLNMIERRNLKFTSAINDYLNKCAAENRDAVQSLIQDSQILIPHRTDSNDDEPGGSLPVRLPPSIPAERNTISEIITEIRTMEWYSNQIVPDGHRVFDPQEPIYGELDYQLSQNLVNALYNARGISQFYSHQTEAINALHAGQNVIVATSTSSGKSLIYQLPVLVELEKDRNARAMYIFPTKALAQDQRRSLKDIMTYLPGLEDLVVETFDGDTPKQDRNHIREEGRIIFTNPDMLHITILPQEEAWRTFLKNLKFVVVDELHVYNGLFGAHVAFIMRRLRRICAAVGNRHVKFISCSATVANPEEHMSTIFGVDDVRLIDFDGSPSGRKEFVCWNTPFKDPEDPKSGRGSAFEEVARLFCQLILRGVRVIAFCRIRRSCEILVGAVKTELTNLERPEVMARVMAYRGGYSPQDRRRIEKEMFDGKLVGIVATSALELGIDIGSLDAVISCGFPYSIANLRQQSGRAGRRNKDSASFLVGDCFPTDQYFMENPDELFTRPNCELQVDLTNLMVVEGHVQCAAFEMPIRPEEDEKYFGKQLKDLAEERLTKDALGFYHCNERFRPQPSKFVQIRDTENDHFAIINITNGKNEVMEELEASRAFFTIYEGGIFLHQGNTYLVKEFSPERLFAKVEYVKVDWITQQRDYTDIDPVETEAIRVIPDSLSRAFYGSIKVKQVVFGYFKLDKRRRILDAVEVDNPPVVIMSKGMWLDVPRQAIEILESRRLNVAAAIHAAEHAILSLMPQYVISMPGDVRTECKYILKEQKKQGETKRKRPARLTFYDAKGGAGGSGISTKAFEFVDLLLKQACERVCACKCQDGCLECCCSERCRDANQVMSKAGAEVILKTFLNWEIDVDSLPWGDEEKFPAGIETIVAAEEVPSRRDRNIEIIQVKMEEGGVRRVVVTSANGNDIDDAHGVLHESEGVTRQLAR